MYKFTKQADVPNKNKNYRRNSQNNNRRKQNPRRTDGNQDLDPRKKQNPRRTDGNQDLDPRKKQNPRRKDENRGLDPRKKQNVDVEVVEYLQKLKHLEEILFREPDDAILSLAEPRNGLVEYLAEPIIKVEIIFQLVKILRRAFSTELYRTEQKFVMRISSSSNLFRTHVAHVLFKPEIEDPTRVVSYLTVIFEAFVVKMPDTCSENLQICVRQCKFVARCHHKEDLVKRLTKIETEIDNFEKIKNQQLREKRRLKMETFDYVDEPPEDFRQIDITPSIEEIRFIKKPFLRKNIVEGKFKNVDHYLDVHFRLLREDFIAKLRTGINDYIKRIKNIDDIWLYENVVVLEPHYNNNGVTYTIQFDTEKFRDVEWDTSRQLTFGSLVCLSNNNFKTAIFGIVADRDLKDLKSGKSKITFEHNVRQQPELQKLDRNGKKYIMVESKAFFEPYKHVMKGLQHFNAHNMPLQQYIVHVEQHMQPPSYLDFDTFYNFSGVVGIKCLPQSQRRVVDINQWPSAEELGLDDSQRRAMHLALSSAVSVIQGPPGTGKSHVGLKIMKMLLANRHVCKFKDSSPILVVAQTNHALDQFLEGILTFPKNVVRVGSRSKNESLVEFNLNEMLNRNGNSSLRVLGIKLKKIRSELNELEKLTDVEMREMRHEKALELYREHNDVVKQYQTAVNVEKLKVMRGKHVIGMTTSGAAKHFSLLQALGHKIVMVEEAAEVLESHIITSLSSNTQHLILIGDHQQLRPRTTVYELAEKYHLDISLFERLIKNEVRYETLQFQHRMRPEISRLLVPNIYKTLKDHPSVWKYPPVKGVKSSIFFLNHDQFEETIVDSTTRSNRFEAGFLVGLCQYLLQQNYEPSQITILTTYAGQLNVLNPLMTSKGVKVAVVDNFQGEENDIILLSFVRSNEEGKIGFLKIINRVNVALSRAKIGLFCVGNFKFLASRSDIWRAIVNDLEIENQISDEMPLVCQKHNHETFVSSGNDFRRLVPNGGCLRPCTKKLPCGHICKLKCHGNKHKNCVKCLKKCQKKACELGHQPENIHFEELPREHVINPRSKPIVLERATTSSTTFHTSEILYYTKTKTKSWCCVL